MNPIVEEMLLMHYGMPRRSGRYPWGSGDNPYQHSSDFLSRVEEMKKSNFKLEEVLYGKDETTEGAGDSIEPRLPMPDEIIGMFNAEPPIEG